MTLKYCSSGILVAYEFEGCRGVHNDLSVDIYYIAQTTATKVRDMNSHDPVAPKIISLGVKGEFGLE